MTSRTVQVPNISCGHCAMTIQRELKELDGVTAVAVEGPTKKVHIEWDESRTSWEAIRSLLEEIHYAPAE